MNSKGVDKVIIGIALCYVLIPIILFFLGWLRLVFAGVGVAFFFVAFYSLYKEVLAVNEESQTALFQKGTSHVWLVSVCVIALWVGLSGIGSFVYQNSDYWVRNPIFRDLSTYDWPVIYDLSKESDLVQQLCGSGKVAFSYYFCWWLPVSAVAHTLRFGEFARNFLLYLWAFIGIWLTFYLLYRKIGSRPYVILAILILFSGMDAIPFLLQTNIFKHPWTTLRWIKHIERWAHYFQYSSNTTQLFWVFNQSIPVWIIMGLFLQVPNGRYNAALLSLTFGYSPWAVFGAVPYAVTDFFVDKKAVKLKFNLVNIGVPLCMLLVFGSFYMASSGSSGFVGTIFGYHSGKTVRVLFFYLVFIFFEFGAYYLVMGKAVRKYGMYLVTIIELLIFPLFIVRDFNFIMRGSIPALFITSYFVTRCLVDQENEVTKSKTRKMQLLVFLCVGALTPLAEFNRTVQKTLLSENYLQEQVGSFGDIKTDNPKLIQTVRAQFFVYNYQQSFFFKYFAKR